MLQPLDVAIFGPLKKRLTAALECLNEAQLVRIQKAEWLSAYIIARTEALSATNIASAFRGAGLLPFNPQRVLRTIKSQPLAEIQRPHTPTEFDILDRVFVNSSPPDTQALQKANQVLKTVLQTRIALNTPTTRYVRNLADATERLNTRDIIRQREIDNLRTIAKARTERKKGKRAALKGHFHISTEELRDAVVEAEKETREKRKKRIEIKQKEASYEPESENEVKEDVNNELDSDIDELGW